MLPTVHSDHPPGTWAPARRAADAIKSPIQRVLAIEAASGIVLLATTLVALVWANVSQSSYASVWHTPLGARAGGWAFERSLHFWVNEGFMTVFFLVVGLEIRREIYEGELATARKAALPLAAALGGMVVPAAIFALLNVGRDGAAGWAIPMATDIAFAVGVLTLLGSRVSSGARVLLLALAVIDDIGAIIVITVFYNADFSPAGLLIVGVGLAVVLAMRSAGVRTPLLYVAPGVVIWAGLLVSGIHPTIAGVVLGLLTPIRSWFGPSGFAATTQAHLDNLRPEDSSALLSSLDAIDQARREAVSPAERLIHVLHPWVAFVVMPIFALANAGVVLKGAQLSGDALWLFLGVVFGLALGKPLGITMTSAAARKARVAALPSDIAGRGVILVGLVAGIGFTMSLFIAQLAFREGPLLDTAKLAILVASATAIISGLVFGVASTRRLREAHV